MASGNTFSMYLSIIIPAYNEERRIPPTLDSVRAFAERMDFPSEVLVVDDGSTDGTTALIEEMCQQNDLLRLVSYPTNRGKGYAVREGMLAATGEYRLFMDADGSMAVEQALDMLTALERSNAQLAIATRYHTQSRNIGQQPVARAAVSCLGRLLIRWTVLPGISDSQCGFKLFTADAADALFPDLATHRWGFDLEILARARALGMRIVDVPVQWQPVAGTKLVAWHATLSVLATTVQVTWCYHTGQYRCDAELQGNDADNH